MEENDKLKMVEPLCKNNGSILHVNLQKSPNTYRTFFHFIAGFVKPYILESLKERLEECKWERNTFNSSGPLANLTGKVPQPRLARKIWALEYTIKYIEENFV